MQNKYLKVLIVIISIIAFTNVAYAEQQNRDATISNVVIRNTNDATTPDSNIANTNSNTTQEEDNVPSIYDVDIKWDNMQFRYIEEEKYIYDENMHIYKRSTQKYWSSNSNNISIKNKSTKKVNINLKFENINTNIKGTFSKNNFNIKTRGEENVKVNLTGNIDNSYSKYKTIGKISIVVS